MINGVNDGCMMAGKFQQMNLMPGTGYEQEEKK